MGVHWHQVQWTLLRVLILWVPRAAQLEDRWSPNELCEAEQSHAYIIKHPISTHWRLVMEYTTSGTVTLLHVLILWVPELENWGQMVSKWMCEGEQFHAYIIKHPIWKHNWLLVMEYTHIRYSDITTCIDSVSARAGETGGRMVSKWIVWGRAVSCLHNQAPNWNTIDFLWWNTSHQYSDITVLILECQSSTTGADGCLQIELLLRRAVSCLHNQAPIRTHLHSLWWESLTQVHVTLLRVLILWVPEQHNWRTDGLQNELCGGEQSHDLHTSSTQWNTMLLWWKHSHQVQWTFTTVLILWRARAWRRNGVGRMVSKWIVWGDGENSLMLT